MCPAMIKFVLGIFLVENDVTKLTILIFMLFTAWSIKQKLNILNKDERKAKKANNKNVKNIPEGMFCWIIYFLR